jgi:ribulose 1,5-bisphosphate carboxylase large subunit-like protein
MRHPRHHDVLNCLSAGLQKRATQQDEADGPYYHQTWEGMKQTTPIISGGMNALRLPAFFENLGHSNVILTAGGGSFGHKDPFLVIILTGSFCFSDFFFSQCELV